MTKNLTLNHIGGLKNLDGSFLVSLGGPLWLLLDRGTGSVGRGSSG